MKRAPKAIFTLNKVVDNPLFEGFALKDAPSQLGRESLDDDIYPAFGRPYGQLEWEPLRLKPTWKEPAATGRVGSYNDFPCISMYYPAFSQRACDALGDLLEPNGELLPIRSNVGVNYYFYNITTIVDALAVEKCKVFWLEPRFIAGEIEVYAFRREKLADLSIFRVYESPLETLVTEEFVRRATEAGLNGMDFTKVWPFPRGVLWREEAKRIRKASKNEPLKKYKCNSLVITLPLEDKKASVAEKKIIKRLEDELDAQLAVSSIDSPFFGWYESCERVPSEFHMILSCPDADRLEKKLSPWLACLAWHSSVHVIKRYGDMYDVNARESAVVYKK